MKIECCTCGQTYPLEGNLFETSPVRHEPLLVCPHCGLQHLLSFLPVGKQLSKPSPFGGHTPNLPKPATSIKLGATYWATLAASRIADASRVDQSGSDDGDVTDWDPTDDFILATILTCDKDLGNRAYKLQWRDVTDEGAFTDVVATGEINYTAATVLQDAQYHTDPQYRLCNAPPGYDWHRVYENEGNNSSLGNMPDDSSTEIQWALSPSSAQYSHQYDFQVYDTTEGGTIGTVLSSLTMMADPAGGCPRQMMHYALRRRNA